MSAQGGRYTSVPQNSQWDLVKDQWKEKSRRLALQTLSVSATRYLRAFRSESPTVLHQKLPTRFVSKFFLDRITSQADLQKPKNEYSSWVVSLRNRYLKNSKRDVA